MVKMGTIITIVGKGGSKERSDERMELIEVGVQLLYEGPFEVAEVSHLDACHLTEAGLHHIEIKPIQYSGHAGQCGEVLFVADGAGAFEGHQCIEKSIKDGFEIMFVLMQLSTQQ